MTETIIQKSIYLRATREQVWDFLVDPKKLSSWFNRPNARLQQDQPLEMYGAQSGDTIIWGTVTAERPPEYLEYTFVVKPMGDTVSVVKWTLTQVPGEPACRLNIPDFRKAPRHLACCFRWTKAGRNT